MSTTPTCGVSRRLGLLNSQDGLTCQNILFRWIIDRITWRASIFVIHFHLYNPYHQKRQVFQVVTFVIIRGGDPHRGRDLHPKVIILSTWIWLDYDDHWVTDISTPPVEFTISDTSKNHPKTLDSDNHINPSRLIGTLNVSDLLLSFIYHCTCCDKNDITWILHVPEKDTCHPLTWFVVYYNR
jgi:hypothetical protein